VELNLDGDYCYASKSTQFKELIRRNIINCKKDPRVIGAKVASSLFVALLVDCVFWGVGRKESHSSQNVLGFLYFSINFTTLSNYLPTILIF
jgi:hypothetical protein